MLEIHTKIDCQECGKSFYALWTSNLPLFRTIAKAVNCPHCHAPNKYAYSFNVNPCKKKKWWEFWKKEPVHAILNHFSKNEGNFDKEYYPRKCNCGAEIILEQERIF